MPLKVRRTILVLEEKCEEAGRLANAPLRKLAIVTVLQNPMLGGYVADLLSSFIEASAELGRDMSAAAVKAFGRDQGQSYGEGGIVDIYVRSHYDGMSLVLPDAPMPNESAIIFCVANRGRLNARVGGLTHEEA